MTDSQPTPGANPKVAADGLPSRAKAKTHEPQDPVPFRAASRANPARANLAMERARACARLGADNRGRDILLLDLRNATPLIDFFVIITATSRRQANAIASEIDKEMKRIGEHKLGMEGAEEARWVLIDYGDFVIHVLSEDAREYYRLEDIWGDAPRLEWSEPKTAPASQSQRESEPESQSPTRSESEAELS